MTKTNRLQLAIAWVLNIGVLLSLLLVTIGGVILLYQYGHQPIDAFILQPSYITINPYHIWRSAFALSPISLIELGLFALIGTQVLRITLLTIFYILIRDIWFTIFSLFILVTMLVSFFLR